MIESRNTDDMSLSSRRGSTQAQLLAQQPGPVLAQQPGPVLAQQPGRILVVGLGNPILGDDGVGWQVAEEVKRRLGNGADGLSTGFHGKAAEAVEVACFSLGGLSLMEHLVGYERVIIIDAINSGRLPAGSISQFRLDELPDRMEGHTSSAHDTSLQTAIEMGRLMGAQLPDEVTVVAIETPNVYDFSDVLSTSAAAAVPVAAALVLVLLKKTN